MLVSFTEAKNAEGHPDLGGRGNQEFNFEYVEFEEILR